MTPPQGDGDAQLRRAQTAFRAASPPPNAKADTTAMSRGGLGLAEGQALGLKGANTRRKLLDAARAILESRSPVKLTATAVSRGAQTSPGTFYVYFNDVSDLVYALCREANDDLQPVLRALDRWRADPVRPMAAAQFIEVFRSHWNQHRAILSIRNMEADRGEPRFQAMRINAGRRMIEPLAALVLSRRELTHHQAVARAVVIFAAIERLAATENTYDYSQSALAPRGELLAAQIAILGELVGEAPATAPQIEA